ncbi:MAG: hypothetical protein ACYDIE_09630 [Candidatus Krumholzibacteriia bacterium]
MKKAHLFLAAAAVALLAPAAVLAEKTTEAQNGPFIHVEVREAGGEEGSVNLNLPLALAQAALAAMQENVDLKARAELGHGDLKVSDLRKMWRAMRDAGDTEFVTVQDAGETVRIYREGEMVFVKVNEGDAKDKVRIRVPVTVMDALLSGEGEQLDLEAAVNQLSSMGKGELVNIEEEAGDSVRIWID